jgi:transposase
VTEAKLDELEESLDPVARSVVVFLKGIIAQRDAQVAAQTAQNAALTQQIARLSEQLSELQRMLFGRRSEKLPPIESEVRRVVEADELTVDGDPMPEDEDAREKEKRRVARKKSETKRKKNRKLKKNLPVVHEQVDVDPSQLTEGMTLDDFREVGCADPVRRVEHVREHIVVVEFALQTLASKDGERLIKARAPAGVTDGCQYGPGLHAHVITAKCADSIPFHRLAKMLDRAGASIARSTLCTVFHRGAKRFVPIYDRFLELARDDAYIHADETTLNVLQPGGCLKGWVWGIMSTQVLAYKFSEDRGAKTANELIGDSAGYLTVDGYSGYNDVTEAVEGESKRTRVGCWGHARRKFYAAMKNVPTAREVLEMIVELYVVERDAAMKGVLGTDAHAKMRKEQSAAIVVRIEAWVDEQHGQHSPKSAMGSALTYAKKQRARLNRFLEDPKLALDNNYAERALRIIALGRKNFLFAGSAEHAQNLAVLQSIVSTCLLHDVNPYEYIRDVIVRLRDRPPDRVDDLLPWNWVPPPDLPPGPTAPKPIPE